MGAIVPLYGDDTGAELAMVPGEDVNELLGLRWNEKKQMYEHPRLEMLRAGKISVQDLDDEELQRGQLRDSDGKFRGGPMRKIPREFHDELMRRILDVGVARIRGKYLAAVDTLVDVMQDTDTDSRLKVDVAKYLIERLAGKTPDRVEVAVAVKPWEKTMESILTEVPAEEQDLEDAEVLDDEDE